MEILKTFLLGIIQGLTEFLPISSSGHLTIFQEIFGMGGMEDKVLLDVLLHIGTLVSVFLVFWKDIKLLFLELFRLIRDIFHGKANLKNPYRRMIVMLIVATLPLIVAVIFKDQVEEFFHNLTLVGFALIVTGFVMFISDRLPRGKLTSRNAPYRSSLLVGIAQMIAIVPGISRSGSTITAGLAVGYTRKFAAKFSFLMSIIAIMGAAVVQVPDAVSMINTTSWYELTGYLLGMVGAAVSGIFAIKFLVNLINKGKFHIFAYYCWAVGLAVLLYQGYVYMF